MYGLTRKAGEAFLKKYDRLDIYCVQISLRITRKVCILNTAKMRSLPNTIIWLDLGRLGSFGQTYVSMALSQILCKLLKICISFGM